MDGGRDGANPSPPLRVGSPGQCGDSRAGEAQQDTLASSDCSRCPLREGTHFVPGRMCWRWGAGRGDLFQLTTCPLTRGGHSRPCELPSEGAPD